MVKKAALTPEQLEHELKLRDSEIEALKRLLEYYRDGLDALTWQNRAAMARAKHMAEELRADAAEV